jgi:hypothetical protein
MPIAKTKKELLEAIETEYRLLKKCIGKNSSAQERELPGVCHEWSAKDVMAHLVEWKKMFLGWYAEGLRGGNPRTPAEDLKWTQTPALNDRIYRKWKDESFAVILAEFESAYAEMLELTRSISEEKLFRKGNSIPGCACGRWQGGSRPRPAAITVGREPGSEDGPTAAGCNQLCPSLPRLKSNAPLPCRRRLQQLAGGQVADQPAVGGQELVAGRSSSRTQRTW